MYKNIDLKEKPFDFEKKLREYWETNNIEKKSIDEREGSKQFVFYEGPPTANGKPGIHHVISRTIKDSVCRYKTMKGFQVKRKAGWDTHGLPVEIEVEKKLGLKNKNDIELYGIEKFNIECKASVFSYEKEWSEMTKTMGYWVDLENPYITLDNNYIETVWWILKQLFDKNLIYKGHKIVPYCPSCGTPLSSHEVAQGYQDVEDPSVFVKFKLSNLACKIADKISPLTSSAQKAEEATFFLAWTTTPWTLISNVALVVNPKETYVKVREKIDKTDSPSTAQIEHLILAKERLSVLDGAYEIVEEYLGKDLEFTKYEQLFDFVKPEEEAFYIANGDYVTMSDGTGIVHTAPAFGQDDYAIGLKYKLPFIQPVDDTGKFTEVITDYKGIFVKDADKSIIRNLKDRNLLYKRTQITHNYPFCWRCKNPLIYYARSTWYIKTSEFKQQMIENNTKINWYPSFVGEKRFGEWLENNVDWALSRDRFWGTPLNIWRCKECSEMVSIGSIEELREKGVMSDGSKVSEQIELHRPFVDNVFIPCSQCNKNGDGSFSGSESSVSTKNVIMMSRTPEVIDCWFDSGAMPYAQWHYPFENKDIFFNELFPADFICEGIDQTRGWFYTLLAISTFVAGKSPFKNCLVNDLILDKHGQKMSKTRGNTIDPMQLMNQYGADAIRWYLISVSPPWSPKKFDLKDVEEVFSKFIGTLKNVYSFFITYANIDKFLPESFENAFKSYLNESDGIKQELRFQNNLKNELDQWIFSRLHSLIEQVIENNEKFDFTRSLRAIQKFVIDELSNWYVRRSRRRYWVMTLTEDKKEAYLTLYEVLLEISKLIAPFAPFLAEEIYTGLTTPFINKSSEKGEKKPEILSVHLDFYPTCNKALINKTLEKEMQTLIDIVTMGRAARNQAQIKVRQTLQALYVSENHQSLIKRMDELIKEEINVKEVILLPENNEIVNWEAKINFKTIGPKYGKDLKIITNFLEKANIKDIITSFKTKKVFEFEIDSAIEGKTPVEIKKFSLTDEDIFISILPQESFAFENYGSDFVALDIRLTEELVLEGHARELVNKIQFTRKENNFDIMDRIKVSFFGNETINEVVKKFKDYISDETLTNDFVSYEKPTECMKLWDINGIDTYLKIEKI
ncbi:MAG: isoleucine--tRNA ligase [Candidatus Cloacimonetes bacterium]|nr:isoleucine--tRNA ligase [Candidatus Cloacimonadota bacterium]